METPTPTSDSRPFEKWLVRSLVAIVGIIALALISGEGLIHHAKQQRETAATPLPEMPNPPEPEALASLQKFFEAPDTLTKSAWVRDAKRVRSAMEDFHDRRGHAYPTLGRVSQGHFAEFASTPYVLFEVEPFHGPRYSVAVCWDGAHFVVDWESMTAYGTMDWTQFIHIQPESPQTLRVFVRQTTQIPAMPPSYTSFLLEHRDDAQPLIAIASGKTSKILTSLTVRARTPVTVELHFQPASPGGSPICVITRLIHPGWSR
ncbi:MAG: hypothetical protein V4640_00205 [Verrucomicrobiota bacterium]